MLQTTWQAEARDLGFSCVHGFSFSVCSALAGF